MKSSLLFILLFSLCLVHAALADNGDIKWERNHGCDLFTVTDANTSIVNTQVSENDSIVYIFTKKDSTYFLTEFKKENNSISQKLKLFNNTNYRFDRSLLTFFKDEISNINYYITITNNDERELSKNKFKATLEIREIDTLSHSSVLKNTKNLALTLPTSDWLFSFNCSLITFPKQKDNFILFKISYNLGIEYMNNQYGGNPGYGISNEIDMNIFFENENVYLAQNTRVGLLKQNNQSANSHITLVEQQEFNGNYKNIAPNNLSKVDIIINNNEFIWSNEFEYFWFKNGFSIDTVKIINPYTEYLDFYDDSNLIAKNLNSYYKYNFIFNYYTKIGINSIGGIIEGANFYNKQNKLLTGFNIENGNLKYFAFDIANNEVVQKDDLFKNLGNSFSAIKVLNNYQYLEFKSDNYYLILNRSYFDSLNMARIVLDKDIYKYGDSVIARIDYSNLPLSYYWNGDTKVNSQNIKFLADQPNQTVNMNYTFDGVNYTLKSKPIYIDSLNIILDKDIYKYGEIVKAKVNFYSKTSQFSWNSKQNINIDTILFPANKENKILTLSYSYDGIKFYTKTINISIDSVSISLNNTSYYPSDAIKAKVAFITQPKQYFWNFGNNIHLNQNIDSIKLITPSDITNFELKYTFDGTNYFTKKIDLYIDGIKIVLSQTKFNLGDTVIAKFEYISKPDSFYWDSPSFSKDSIFKFVLAKNKIIRLQYRFGNSPFKWITKTVELIPLDIEDFSENTFDIELYPNPATNILNINYLGDPKGIVLIYNDKGELKKIPPSNYLSIDISSLLSGTYFLKLESSDNIIAIKKFVIAR